MSFLSYADLINAERVEAAEREASGLGTGGVPGAGGVAGAGGPGWQGFGDVGEVPGLLWAALGDHQAGQQAGLFGGGKGGDDEEEVLRAGGGGPVASEDERTGLRW